MKKLVQSLFILLFVTTTVLAQERTITGTVTSAEDGLPLPGVAVSVKGSASGTQTNVNGQYSIKTSVSNPVLVFSFIGTKTQELAVPSSNVLNVSLATDAEQLSEVVVVGYSTTTRQAFTGTAKVVNSENIERKNVSNVSQALAGEVSGLRVINTSGQPGKEATIRVRGLGSVNGNRDPLYVVDGVPFVGSLNSISPEDIESVTVLKDAAATAIYGSRGANGVIVVTTKTGKGKKSFIEVDAKTGANMSLLPRYKSIKSPEQYIGLAWEAVYNEGVANGESDPIDYANTYLFDDDWGIATGYNMWNVANTSELIDPVTRKVRAGVTRKYTPENWEDYAFQSSTRNDINVKFGGSSERNNYFSSLGYLKDKGYSINSGYERISARINVNQEIKPWLKGSANFGYARSKTNRGGQSEDSGSIFWFVDNIPSIYPLYMRDANGEFVVDPIFGGNQYDYGTVTPRGFGGLTNAIADAAYDTQRDDRNEINGSVNLDFTITKGLTFENRVGLQYYDNRFVIRNNKFYGSAASQNGSLFHERENMTAYNILNLLRYKTSIEDHNLEFLAAHEASKYDRQVLTASGYNLVDPNIEELNNAVVFNPSTSYRNRYGLESYFGQINYDYKNKYYFSATFRRDGSSRFLNDKWGNFGSVGASWLISSEDFMKGQSLISNLKLRTSYGLIGDQAGVGYYPGYDLYDVNNLNDNPAFSFYSKGNPNLTWERSKMFQLGVDFSIKNYLTASLDYYIKNTDNLIFERRVGPSLGYAIVQVNDGNLRNQGFEFDLTGHVVRTKDWRFDVNINGEILKNKITEMPIDPTTNAQKPIDVQSPFGWSVGHSIFDFYMREWAGVDPNDGRGMWNVYYNDANGNGVLDSGEGITNLSDYLSKNPAINQGDLKTTTTKSYASATQKYVGKSAIPDVRGAFNLSAGYKGFDLNVQFLYSFGGYAYDYVYASLMNNEIVGYNNWHTDIERRWQKAGDVTDVPRINNDLDQNVASLSSRFLTKANYLTLNNIRLGYTFPQSITKQIGVQSLGLWVSGDNLWIHTARKGFNPSASEAGSSNKTDEQTRYMYSPLSTISAGLRVNF